MLRIRLARTGKRNQPSYRLVVAEHARPVKGKFLEVLGHYNPRSKELIVDRALVDAWRKKGAQCSLTAEKLLARPVAPSPRG